MQYNIIEPDPKPQPPRIVEISVPEETAKVICLLTYRHLAHFDQIDTDTRNFFHSLEVALDFDPEEAGHTGSGIVTCHRDVS